MRSPRFRHLSLALAELHVSTTQCRPRNRRLGLLLSLPVRCTSCQKDRISRIRRLGPARVAVGRREARSSNLRDLDGANDEDFLSLERQLTSSFLFFLLFLQFPIAELIESGFGEEPILQNVLNVLECRCLQDLKYRARIEIKQGAFLLGVVDELGVLEEGEVSGEVRKAKGRSSS